MLNTIADWLIKKAKDNPAGHLEGYMERYWLIPFNRFNVAVRIHHLLRSDKDTFHDHPWRNISFILKGGYWEVVPVYNPSGLYCGESRTWRGAGSLIFRSHKSWHRLEVEKGIEPWSLFIMFKWKQKWGFLIAPENKVSYNKFFDIEETNNDHY